MASPLSGLNWTHQLIVGPKFRVHNPNLKVSRSNATPKCRRQQPRCSAYWELRRWDKAIRMGRISRVNGLSMNPRVSMLPPQAVRRHALRLI